MKMYHQAIAADDYKEANIPLMVYDPGRDVIFFFFFLKNYKNFID